MAGNARCTRIGASWVPVRLRDLRVQAAREITVSATVKPDWPTGPMLSTATVAGLENDPRPENNTVLITTTIVLPRSHLPVAIWQSLAGR